MPDSPEGQAALHFIHLQVQCSMNDPVQVVGLALETCDGLVLVLTVLGWHKY